MGTRLTSVQRNGFLISAGPFAQYPSQLIFNDYPVMAAAVGSASLYHSYKLFSASYPDTPVIISPNAPFVAAQGFELKPPIRIETDGAPETLGVSLGYDIYLYRSVPSSMPASTRARYVATNRGLPQFLNGTSGNLIAFTSGRKLIRVSVLNRTAGSAYVWYRQGMLKTTFDISYLQVRPESPDVCGPNSASGGLNPPFPAGPYALMVREFTTNIPDYLSITCTSDAAGTTPLGNEDSAGSNVGVSIEVEAYD